MGWMQLTGRQRRRQRKLWSALSAYYAQDYAMADRMMAMIIEQEVPNVSEKIALEALEDERSSHGR